MEVVACGLRCCGAQGLSGRGAQVGHNSGWLSGNVRTHASPMAQVWAASGLHDMSRYGMGWSGGYESGVWAGGVHVPSGSASGVGSGSGSVRGEAGDLLLWSPREALVETDTAKAVPGTVFSGVEAGGGGRHSTSDDAVVVRLPGENQTEVPLTLNTAMPGHRGHAALQSRSFAARDKTMQEAPQLTPAQVSGQSAPVALDRPSGELLQLLYGTGGPSFQQQTLTVSRKRSRQSSLPVSRRGSLNDDVDNDEAASPQPELPSVLPFPLMPSKPPQIGSTSQEVSMATLGAASFDCSVASSLSTKPAAARAQERASGEAPGPSSQSPAPSTVIIHSKHILDTIAALGFTMNHCRALLKIAAHRVAKFPRSFTQEVLLARLEVCVVMMDGV